MLDTVLEGMKNMIVSLALETRIFSISTLNVFTKCSKFLNDAFSRAEPCLAWSSNMFSSFLLLACTEEGSSSDHNRESDTEIFFAMT